MYYPSGGVAGRVRACVCVCVCAYPCLFSTATLIHIIHQDLDCQIGKVQWHEMHLGISFHPFFYIENVQLIVSLLWLPQVQKVVLDVVSSRC